MPLRDHFHGPFAERAPWDMVHGGWPMVIATALSARLPSEYFAGPFVHLSGARGHTHAHLQYLLYQLFPAKPSRIPGAFANPPQAGPPRHGAGVDLADIHVLFRQLALWNSRLSVRSRRVGWHVI